MATGWAVMAAVDQVKRQVDAAAAGTGYRCVPVSWEDAQRSGTGFGLQSGGPNISDVRLFERSGALLYTLRSENWNERLGYVSASDVALVTGNERATASVQSPTTLADYLQHIGTHAAYAGLKTPSLYEPTLDTLFGIRFQTVFLPTPAASPFGTAFGAKPSVEFTTEVYNYQTRTATDPKNLLLLATPQGVSVQQDSPGKGRLFFHSVDARGVVHRYWLEAEKSEQSVGGAQSEALAEMAAAAARGKATAVRIGTAAMGTRFNAQLLIQVPLKQRPPPPPAPAWGSGGGGGGGWGAPAPFCAPPPQNSCALGDAFGGSAPQAMAFAAPAAAAGFGAKAPTAVGTSNAARVSRGSLEDTWGGVARADPSRDPAQHGTITVTMYYTVVGGVPSADDVKRAVADLDALYKACPSDKRLAQCHEVTAKGFAPPPPPPPKVAWPTVPAPPPVAAAVAPAALPSMATLGLGRARACACPQGHPLSPQQAIGMPPGGLWCDACGVFTPSDEAGTASAAGIPRVFSCRPCDYDLCARCAVGPRCPAGHALCRLPQGELSGFAVCTSCTRQFANRAAVMRGCTAPSCPSSAAATALCESCYALAMARALA